MVFLGTLSKWDEAKEVMLTKYHEFTDENREIEWGARFESSSEKLNLIKHFVPQRQNELSRTIKL